MRTSVILCVLPVFFYIFASGASAQPVGNVNGKVIDSVSGEPIIGVNVIIREHKIVAVTDLDGKYVLQNVPAGKQKIEFRMMIYNTSVAEVDIAPGNDNRVNITMSYQTVQEVVVKARRINNTAAALMSVRKKAPVAQDAISAEQISKSPDSDAGDAAKRVTGVTIVSGNAVFIRGLGERYASVMLSGSIIPSPDPDKRVVPLDIFPTALLDNLVIIKAYTPDMPGEFAGGIVQINPRDYPDETSFKVSAGTGFHSNTTGRDFLIYDGGKYDYFGFDDGTREMPGGIGTDLRSSSYSPGQIEAIGESFKNEYTPDKSMAKLPVSLNFSYGDSFKPGSKTLGIIFSGLFKNNYKNKDLHYYRLNDNWQTLKDLNIEKSTYSTNKGLLLSTALNGVSNKFRLTSFYTHQSEDSASIYSGYNNDRQEGDPGDISAEKRYKLQYMAQDLFFNQLEGEHFLKSVFGSTVNWTGQYSRATRKEPDTRTVQLIDYDSSGAYYLYRPDDVRRFFQEHVENIYGFSPSISIPFKQWQGLMSKIKVGSGFNYRKRESEARTFKWGNDNLSTSPAEPVEGIFTPGNIDENNYYMSETTAEYDNYDGILKIISAYSQVDIPIISKLRLVGGARYEYSDMDMISYDPTTGEKRDLEKEPLISDNIMPGASLTYAVAENTNIRAAYSKTVARPDFREVSEFKYSPMISNVEIIGNPDLKQCNVQNLDFRFEWFPTENEIAAVSIFYKYLKNPIEMLEVPGSGGSETYTYANANFANNMGAEIEFKKSFSFISEKLSDLSMSLNFAYIYSVIDVDDEVADYSSNKRALQGQSPYIINTSLNYDNEKTGTSFGLLFNISGRRIVRVGTVSSGVERGDVYEEAVPKLDFIAKQDICSNGQLKLTVSNILDPEIKETQERPNAATGEKKTFTLDSYKDGISVGLSYSHSF